MRQIFEQIQHRAARLYDDILAGRLAGWRTYVFAYIVSATVLILAFVTRDSLDPVTGARLIFALSIPAILISAAAGGWGPGLFATGQTAAAAFLFMPPKASLMTQILLLLLHAAVGLLIIWGGEQLRQSRRRGSTAEDELTARDGQIRAILKTCPDATIIIDPVGRIVAFNRAAETLFGQKESQLVGKAASLLLPAQADPNRDTHTTTARRNDGSVFPARLATGEFRADGRVYVIAFIRDLSDAPKLQDDIAPGT
ncbi:sensor protein fixL [Asticcacaulis biprosthecium C19]|uniref:Sensor protein fixL n=1 Tax=Asticcacaulis biprosthecium C19 TaxID=715226 RepID=F4QID3_9CAUL|nr:PAS domain S-box protein [Asticcacaulis biprosthecium]EGF91771.1 sensor protein fixL [Asticcacaulis biprosthecium C19]